ncbi:MAG: CopD family protein, partial [Castellaniella sp.]
HVATAAAWLGAFVPLIRLSGTGRNGTEGLAPLAWFSRWITPVVAVLLASGAGLALLQLNRPADLWRTPYGIVLSAKLALVCGLLVIAAFNRWQCTGSALAGDAAARWRLRRGILLETVVAVVLLGVVSLWRFTPPPRSLDAAAVDIPEDTLVRRHAHAPASFTLSGDRAQATVTRSGATWSVLLTDRAGKPFAAQGLTLALSNPQAGIEPLRREARRLADGRWHAETGSLPSPGIGHLRLGLEILVDDFDQVTLEEPLPP